MASQKVAKLAKVRSLLEGEQSTRKLSLETAKANFRACDPDLDIRSLLREANSGRSKEALVYFLCDNYLTPWLVKLLSSK